jgi:hypothetical protein
VKMIACTKVETLRSSKSYDTKTMMIQGMALLAMSFVMTNNVFPLHSNEHFKQNTIQSMQNDSVVQKDIFKIPRSPLYCQNVVDVRFSPSNDSVNENELDIVEQRDKELAEKLQTILEELYEGLERIAKSEALEAEALSLKDVLTRAQEKWIGKHWSQLQNQAKNISVKQIDLESSQPPSILSIKYQQRSA